MKILIWGTEGSLIPEFISRLKKEKHEVYVIHNNNRRTAKRIKGTFEEYYIDYTKEQILTIIHNVAPDICMFLEDIQLNIIEQKNYINYVSGLTNAVISSKMAGIRYFYYLSSTQVFNSNREKIIKDSSIPNEDSEIAKRILQCEQTCLVNQNQSFHTIILRCAELYEPSFFSCIDNIALSILYDASVHGKALVRKNYHHTVMNAKDASDAIYRVISEKKNYSYPVCIAPDSTIEEEELAEWIKETLDIEYTVRETEEVSYPHKYECESVKKLHFILKYEFKKEISFLCKNSEKWEKRTNKKEKQKIFPISFLETFFAFLLVQILVQYTYSYEFHKMIDMYLILVLIISVLHGTLNAAFAILLSAIGKILLLLQTGGAFQELAYYLWLLELLGVGTLTGYMKDKYKKRTLDLEDEKEYLNHELKYAQDINKNGQEIKSIYEKRLLNYQDSFAKISNIVSELDYLEPQKIVFEAVHVVERVMNTDHVCIYTIDQKSKFARLLASSKMKKSALGKSFNLLDYPEVYQVLEKKEVFINRSMDPKLPILIKALTEKQEISSMVMVYSLDFDIFGLQEVNMFAVLCNMIEKSVSRAYTYMEGVKYNNYIEETNIMRWDAFKKVLELYCYGEANNLLEYSLIRLKSASAYQDIIQKLSRTTDYLGKSEENYYILLTNTSEKDSDIVRDRFRNIGIDTEYIRKGKGNTIDEVYPSLKEEITNKYLALHIE